MFATREISLARRGGVRTAKAIQKKLVTLMAAEGWRVEKFYHATTGSLYLQFVSAGPIEVLSGKIRITDHRELSSNHVAPEIEITSLVRDVNWSELVSAIINGEQGEF